MSEPATVTSRSFYAFSALWRAMATTLFVAALVLPALAAGPQQRNEDDKHLDIRSSVGDLHVGKDADARRAGLPLYPGARLRPDDSDNDRVNMGIVTEAFGLKLVVAHYESDDAPAMIINYYRDKLKSYGKVLECHTHQHGGNVHAEADAKEEQHSKELKCDDNDGSITELKVGTEDNQHVVAVEPASSGKGSTFTLVYVHTRGKQGEI
jgi:hypothetical protein